MPRKTKAKEKQDDQSFKEIEEFIQDFKNESDRAAVILGAAKLDNYLYQILSIDLLPSTTSKDDLLDGDSPLGTFSSRILMCYRLGLITGDFAKTLNLIRKIRNSFAHEISGANLNNAGHSDRIRELALPFKNLRDYEALRHHFFETTDIASDFRTVLTIALVRLQSLTVKVEKKFKVCIEPYNIIPEKWLEKEEKLKLQREQRQKRKEE